MSDTTTAPPGVPLRIDHLSKHFGRRRGRVTALDDVSLQFPASSFTAVLGASGSGKSTLLQCAAGLERPSSGRVSPCGTDPAADVDGSGLRSAGATRSAMPPGVGITTSDRGYPDVARRP
jgi:ABC-type multidrug transport system ATPase subunit